MRMTIFVDAVPSLTYIPYIRWRGAGEDEEIKMLVDRYKVHFVDRHDEIRGVAAVVEAATAADAMRQVSARLRLPVDRLYAEPSCDLLT